MHTNQDWENDCLFRINNIQQQRIKACIEINGSIALGRVTAREPAPRMNQSCHRMGSNLPDGFDPNSKEGVTKTYGNDITWTVPLLHLLLDSNVEC